MVLEKADGIRNEESVVAWFYSPLRNAVVDHHPRGHGAARTAASTAPAGRNRRLRSEPALM
jgi:hypothetical protein